jgi:hypothetical protein
MSEPAYQTPYTPTPGGSIPPAHMRPEQGREELWGFFWLSLVNTVIIAVVGVAVWWFVH